MQPFYQQKHNVLAFFMGFKVITPFLSTWLLIRPPLKLEIEIYFLATFLLLTAASHLAMMVNMTKSKRKKCHLWNTLLFQAKVFPDISHICVELGKMGNFLTVTLYSLALRLLIVFTLYFSTYCSTMVSRVQINQNTYTGLVPCRHNYSGLKCTHGELFCNRYSGIAYSQTGIQNYFCI